MSRRVVLTHLCILVGWLAGAAGFFGLGQTRTRVTVYETVRLGAFSAVGILAYSLVFECLRVCTPVRWGLRRRGGSRDTPGYTDLPGPTGTTVVIEGVPKLTMESVWSLVYGLGMVFFVALYCFSAQQPVCYYFFSIGLVVLCVDEASVHSSDCNRCLPQLAVTILGGLAIAFVVVDLGFPLEDTDLFGVMWGIVLPAVTPMFFWYIKTNRRYTLGGVIELCEFGMPFASIIGVLCICVMDARALPSLHELASLNATLASTDPGVVVTALASPWILVPCVVFFTGAVLQNRSVDPLVAIAVVVSAQHVFASAESPLSVTAVIFAGVAAGIRVWSVPSTASDAANTPAHVDAAAEYDVDAV